jgi:hypothetical protein
LLLHDHILFGQSLLHLFDILHFNIIDLTQIKKTTKLKGSFFNFNLDILEILFLELAVFHFFWVTLFVWGWALIGVTFMHVLNLEAVLVNQIKRQDTEHIHIFLVHDGEQVYNDCLQPRWEELDTWNGDRQTDNPVEGAVLVLDEWLLVIRLVDTSEVKYDELDKLTFYAQLVGTVVFEWFEPYCNKNISHCKYDANQHLHLIRNYTHVFHCKYDQKFLVNYNDIPEPESVF